MSVVEGIQRDLKAIGKRDRALAEGALAMSALTLAEGIDDRDNSFTSRGIAAHELRETMDRLRELAPEEEAEDALDDIKRQRLKRRKAG